MGSPVRESWDEDQAVQTTNDDAQASKASCVQLGYFEDKFIQYFVRKKGSWRALPCLLLEQARQGSADDPAMRE